MTPASNGWYVAAPDGSARGPFDRQELIALRSRQALAEDALVWNVDLAEWVPLKRALPPASASVTLQLPTPVMQTAPPALAPSIPKALAAPAVVKAIRGSAPRVALPEAIKPDAAAVGAKLRTNLERLQWGARRWLARLIDYAVFGGIAWALVVLGAEHFRAEAMPSFSDSLLRFSLLLVIALGLLALPLEILSLSLGGYTPGKLVVGLRVIRRDGGYLDPALAAKRATSTLFKGVGFWIPPFSIIAMALSLRTLLTDGRAGWDQALNLDVDYGPMPGNRWFASFAVLVLAYTALAEDLFRQGLWHLLR